MSDMTLDSDGSSTWRRIVQLMGVRGNAFDVRVAIVKSRSDLKWLMLGRIRYNAAS